MDGNVGAGEVGGATGHSDKQNWSWCLPPHRPHTGRASGIPVLEPTMHNTYMHLLMNNNIIYTCIFDDII